MNRRLALIDRVAEIIHDERRQRSPHHCGPLIGSCIDCRDDATLVVDHVVPVLAPEEVGR